MAIPTTNSTLARYQAGVKLLLDWCEAHDDASSSVQRCARVILGCWNGSEHPMSLRGVRDLNENLRDACLDVIRGYVMTGKEPHQFGDEARIHALHFRVVAMREPERVE